METVVTHAPAVTHPGAATEPFGGAFRGRRVWVTGHTGFKGAWLCEWLLQLGAEVHGLSLGLVSQPSLFGELGLERRMAHRLGDVRDLATVRAAFTDARPEIVFHLAAQPLVRLSYAEPVATFATNLLGTVHVLEALRAAREPCSAVLITSDKCYLNVEWDWGYRETDTLGGHDPYSASKGAAELAIRGYHASYFSAADAAVRLGAVRAGNVIGGGDWAADRIVPDCVRAWERGVPVAIRSSTATRPWQHVLEPLSGYLALGAALHRRALRGGEAFNFGPTAEQSATVQALVEALAGHWPGAGGGTPLTRTAAPPGLREAGLLKLNCDKALAQLAWRPALGFADTAAYTARWYREHLGGGDAHAFTSAQIADYVAAARARGIAWAGAGA